ncbi:hypothetical protein EJ02DRAFT_114569 [Clathrospora elynae]|uniref:Uncharacterized protein n=1 Tax=Clathrospora elynae TaxID=706981 RepID=A0A6A5SZY1_9PLEO|nr:hypothetical protein EJ02DRAFT_114569 [Clathrospora elynae]
MLCALNTKNLGVAAEDSQRIPDIFSLSSSLNEYTSNGTIVSCVPNTRGYNTTSQHTTDRRKVYRVQLLSGGRCRSRMRRYANVLLGFSITIFQKYILTNVHIHSCFIDG